MATDDTATIIRLHQPARPKTGAERARAYRARKRAKASPVSNETAPVAYAEPVEIPAELPERVTFTACDDVTPVTSRPVTAPVTSVTSPVTAAHKNLAPVMLTVAAICLAMVGITMNGWYARTMGSSDTAGWLFLAIGVAADLVALATPTCAAKLWHARQRGTALAGWAVWAATFAFALTASIGFASVNISDVTTARGERVTPAVTAAQTALRDAMTSRDRECRDGLGKICRQREATVTERQAALNTAMATVERTADPQIEAASKVVAWLTGGLVHPGADDFAMLRLVLLALLPQLGGILLMIGRPPK